MRRTTREQIAEKYGSHVDKMLVADGCTKLKARKPEEQLIFLEKSSIKRL